MKIEMAEQMFSSYLKNIEGCQITQTNWTPSNIIISYVSSTSKDTIRNMMDEIITLNPDLNIFSGSVIFPALLDTFIRIKSSFSSVLIFTYLPFKGHSAL